MAQLSYQQVQLLIRLLEACKPLSASELGASLNLSPRQVRYALGGTSGWLAGFDLALKMQPGVGIEVRGTDSRKEAALEALRDMKSRSRVWQPEQRRRLLALYLLMSDEAIILHHLQNVAKVSRRVIVSDLEHVGRWMERFYLGLKRRRNYGVWVDGTEKDKRQALAALMWGDFPEADGALRVVYEHGIQFAKATLPLCDLVLLTADMVDQVDVRRGLRFVARAEHAMSTRFTDEGGLALALAMAIQSWRIQQGRLVELPAESISWLQGLPIWEVAANIGKQMAWWANVGTLPAAEIALLGATLMATPRDKPWSGDMAANPRLVEALEVFLADVAQTYQLPTLVDDVSLYDACLVQVVTRYFRERFGLWMPQYEVDLPAKYRREKEIAERLSSHLSERVGVSLSSAEVANVALALRGAYMRVRPRPAPRILIVCPSGMATAQVLMARVKSYFPHLQDIQVASVRHLYQRDLSSVDLILTTAPLDQEFPPHVHVILVHPLLTREDVEALTAWLVEHWDR